MGLYDKGRSVAPDSKGQEISKGNFDVFNFPKKTEKNSLTSALVSKKWSKNKGYFLFDHFIDARSTLL